MPDYFEVVTESGEKYRHASGDWTPEQIDWVRNSAKELYYVPASGKTARLDASQFSPSTSQIGATSQELAPQYGEDTRTLEEEAPMSVPVRAARAASRVGLGGVSGLADIYLGIRQIVEPAVRKILPESALRGDPTTQELREDIESSLGKKIESLGGEDFWFKVGEWAGLAATALTTRAGVERGVAGTFPKLTAPIKDTFMKLIAAGDKAGARKLLLSLAGREAAIEAGSGLIHETARTGDIKEGLKAAPVWGAFGAAFGGAGAIGAKRAVTKTLSDADNETAKKLVSELWSDIVSLKGVSEEAYEARKLYSGVWAKAKSFLTDGEQVASEAGALLKDPAPSMVWVTRPLSLVKKAKTGDDTSKLATEYLQANALSAELKRNPGYKLPDGWSAERISKTKDMINKALKESDVQSYAAIKEFERRVFAHNDWKLDYLKKTGVIGENDIKRMKTARDYYFTLSRELPEETLKALGGKTGTALKRRSAEGSALELADPIEAMTKDFALTIAIAERNKMLSDIVTDIVKKPNTAKMVSIIKRGKPDKVYSLGDVPERLVKDAKELKPNQFVFSVDVGGGEVAKQIIQIDDPLIAKAMQTYNPKELSEFWKVVSGISETSAKIKRGGIVFTPSFAMRNLLKSIEQASIHDPAKLGNFMPYAVPKNIYNTMRAAGRILKGSKQDLGEGIPKSLDEAFKLGNIEAMFLQYGGGGMVQEGKTAIAENAVRSSVAESVYFNAIKNGALPEEAAKKAALARRNIGGDYGEKGELIRVAGKHIPFFNATIAGTRDVVESIKRDPEGFALRTAQIVIAPTVARFYALKDQDWYWAIPASQRVTRAYLSENVWIPRSYSLPGFIGFATEEMLRIAYKTNPADIEPWMQALQAYAISTPIPPIAELAAMKIFGKDLFTKSSIEPPYSENENKYERATSGTTEAAKRIASIQKNMASGGIISPAEIDAYAKAVGGPTAQTAMQVASRALSAIEGGISPAAKAADFPAVVPFVSESPMERSSDYINRLYEYDQRIKRIEKGKKNAQENNDPDRVAEILDRNSNILANKRRVDSAIKRLADLRDKYMDVKDPKNVSMSSKEKRDRMSEIMATMNEIAMDVMIDIEQGE